MDTKKLLYGSLAVGGASAVTRILFAKLASAKPTASSASYEAIDAFIEQQMRRLHTPGASLAIIEGNQIVHRRGFGCAHPYSEPPSAQTPFFIGSLIKSFTALAVMQLVEAGKVELDAPVQRYLPWFTVADLQASAEMTVRHLLNQTSSLPNSFVLPDFDDRPDATERQVNFRRRKPIMINIFKKHHGMSIIGQGGKIILFTPASGIAVIMVQVYYPKSPPCLRASILSSPWVTYYSFPA